MEHLYRDFGSWLREHFPCRVQKISIDAGFTCPNRDGNISQGGCTYCDNRTFSPAYCSNRKSISRQLEEGKAFFARKYPDMRYLAYFQTYTNTYASLQSLKRLYEEALGVEGVVGIVIGTRPDCVGKPLLDYLEQLSRHTFVLVEYGVETANNDTLRRINRGHTFECSRQAIEQTHARGILTGAHVIIGLPGETPEESIGQAATISSLPINILKIHQLQIIRHTQLAREFAERPFHVYSIDEYINTLTSYIQHLRADLALERFVSQTPANLLVAPRWGLKNHEFTDLLKRTMRQRKAFQGELYQTT